MLGEPKLTAKNTKGIVVEELSEKEQLEAMRSWWSENGSYVIGGVVLGVAILFGWNQWRSSVSTAQIEASEMYEEVMTSVGNGNADAATSAAAVLFESHAGSIYAAQGKLAMARLYMDKGRDQDAALVLRQLVDDDPNSEIGLVGRLRLAKVLLYQDKAEEVVALLENHLDNAFAARFNEVLGDAYAALGSIASAEAAYNAALADVAAARTIDTNLIQLKINDLPAVDDSEELPAETPDVAPAANDDNDVDSADTSSELPSDDVAQDAAEEMPIADEPAASGAETQK